MAVKLTEALLNEIFVAFIDAGVNPSQELLEALANFASITPAIAKQHFTARYKERTGTDDDPFGPVDMEQG